MLVRLTVGAGRCSFCCGPALVLGRHCLPGPQSWGFLSIAAPPPLKANVCLPSVVQLEADGISLPLQALRDLPSCGFRILGLGQFPALHQSRDSFLLSLSQRWNFACALGENRSDALPR